MAKKAAEEAGSLAITRSGCLGGGIRKLARQRKKEYLEGDRDGGSAGR